MSSIESKISPLGHASPERYQHGAWPAALLERMAKWVKNVHPCDKYILDIGCGEGALLHRLGLTGIGVDLNPDRLKLACDRNLSVLLGDGTRLPFDNLQFSTVVSMEVLEHVPKMEDMLQEVFRVLDHGGTWVVSVPSVTLRSKYEMWREQRPYYCDGDEHYREFTPVELEGFENRFMLIPAFETLFEENGFEVVRRDGVRYLFPQWFSRLPLLQKIIESPSADRFWSVIPWVKNYPYWTIIVLRKPD